jgi:hypothetical protein
MNMAKHTEFCIHYRAMSEHKTCENDIEYESFKGLTFDQRPCFERNGVAPPGCSLAEFPTAEQRAEWEREINERFAKIGKARAAIVEHLGGPWKKGTPGGSGVIDCPACEGKQSLRFSRAGYNGHVHAACATDGCVRWME